MKKIRPISYNIVKKLLNELFKLVFIQNLIEICFTYLKQKMK